MQACAPPHKVLVAVDGSEQSLRAIRYAANVFPPDRTRILLFHVQAQLFELFSDLNAYPRYERRVSGLKRSATERKMDIANTMDSAVVYFKQKGFTESAIRVKTSDRKLGITQDIIKESYDGYHAIVVGRTEWSRFKDWLIKSTAMQLVAKIKHIPVVVVGKPDAKNLLVAFDGTHGAIRGVACVAGNVGSSPAALKYDQPRGKILGRRRGVLHSRKYRRSNGSDQAPDRPPPGRSPRQAAGRGDVTRPHFDQDSRR